METFEVPKSHKGKRKNAEAEILIDSASANFLLLFYYTIACCLKIHGDFVGSVIGWR
jgi:hypothetical protein